MDAQLKRGFLGVCVLASINRQDSYGYQIVKDVPSSLHLTESTLYPLLKRLESEGFTPSSTTGACASTIASRRPGSRTSTSS